MIPQVQFSVKVICPSGVFGHTVQKTVDFLQLPLIAGRRHPGHGAEADSHGFSCLKTIETPHRSFFLVVDAPVVQVVFLAGCRARQMPMVLTLRVPQVQFLRGGGRRCVSAATSSSCRS